MLSPSEANSGKLVTMVMQNAKILAERENCNFIIIDEPPGIGCPVDAGLVVTEPTMSGIHDLKRALQLLEHFNVQPFVCVNIYDINKDNAEKIESFCKENGIDVIGNILFNPIVTKAMVDGKTIIEYSPISAVAKEIEGIWEKLSALVSEKSFTQELLTKKEVIGLLSKIPINLERISKENLDKEILGAGIITELDAINLYEQMAAMTQNAEIKTTLLNIAKEEKTHVGEFQALLLIKDEEQEKELEEGRKEVKELKK